MIDQNHLILLSFGKTEDTVGKIILVDNLGDNSRR